MRRNGNGKIILNSIRVTPLKDVYIIILLNLQAEIEPLLMIIWFLTYQINHLVNQTKLY